MVEPYKPLYTVKEVSEILKVNVSTVYQLIKSKQLPPIKLGAVKIRGADLENFINNYPTGVGKEETA